MTPNIKMIGTRLVERDESSLKRSKHRHDQEYDADEDWQGFTLRKDKPFCRRIDHEIFTRHDVHLGTGDPRPIFKFQNMRIQDSRITDVVTDQILARLRSAT